MKAEKVFKDLGIKINLKPEYIMKIEKKVYPTQNLKPVYPTSELTIRVADDADYGGAHNYEFDNCLGWNDGMTAYDDSTQTIQFVQKKEDGTIIPGLQSEQLLIALIDRHEKLNKKFPCYENELMITKLQEALMWQEQRLRNRVDRGVMGELKE